MNITSYDAHYSESITSDDMKSMFKYEFGFILVIALLILI